MRPAFKLAAIAGGRSDILEQSPSDLTRYAAMGGVVLATAAVASVSSAIAVNMSLKVSPGWSVVVGAMWGLFILTLDRMLITQMVRQQGRHQQLLLALPRLGLALILGLIISTPLVLMIFDSEITTELGVMHKQQLSAYTQQVDSTIYRDIPPLKKTLASAQQTLETDPTSGVDQDPDVKAAQARFNGAEQAYEKAEQNVVCEKEGTCGSGKVGAGIAYLEKVAIRDDAKRERDDAQAALYAARRTATAKLSAAQRALHNNATQTSGTTAAQLKALQDQRTADLRHQTQLIKADTGMLARLEALSKLTGNRPTLLVAHIALFLLFLSIEILPVVAKLLQLLGPESTYERMARRADAHALDLQKRELRSEKKLERDRLRRAHDAGTEYNKVMVETQSSIVQSALSAWAEHATEASQAALDAWRRGVVQQPAPAAASNPPVAQPPRLIDLTAPAPTAAPPPAPQPRGQVGGDPQLGQTTPHPAPIVITGWPQVDDNEPAASADLNWAPPNVEPEYGIPAVHDSALQLVPDPTPAPDERGANPLLNGHRSIDGQPPRVEFTFEDDGYGHETPDAPNP